MFKLLLELCSSECLDISSFALLFIVKREFKAELLPKGWILMRRNSCLGVKISARQEYFVSKNHDLVNCELFITKINLVKIETWVQDTENF